ncbi:ribosomal protein L7/L12 [Streptomyces sp. NPDC056400]|uniref:ribosomal protein L7/L12 n=1 Tax=Streptomyces sp. NPDC056400 TaxID=3345808 RepID=UPI0035E3750D
MRTINGAGVLHHPQATPRCRISPARGVRAGLVGATRTAVPLLPGDAVVRPVRGDRGVGRTHGSQPRGWFTCSTAGDHGGGCVEEPGFRVLLTESGDRKMEAIRAIRTVTGLSLWNSKLLLDGAPVAVTGPVWLETAQDVAGALEAAGANATVICDWCDRTITRAAGQLDPAPCSGPWPPEACRASCPPHRQRTGENHHRRTHRRI